VRVVLIEVIMAVPLTGWGLLAPVGGARAGPSPAPSAVHRRRGSAIKGAEQRIMSERSGPQGAHDALRPLIAEGRRCEARRRQHRAAPKGRRPPRRLARAALSANPTRAEMERSGCRWCWAYSGAMTGQTWAELTPGWVVPPLVEFTTYAPMAFRLEEITGCWQARGQCAALCWLIGRNTAPITDGDDPVTIEVARRESWLALGVAAGHPAAAQRERAWRGLSPFRIVPGSAWWAHGVWRTLSWVTGERPDPPIDLPVLAEDGSVCPGTQVYAIPRQPDAQWWQAFEARREQRELAEADQWWRNSHPMSDQAGRR
jgi:hypothetical protein